MATCSGEVEEVACMPCVWYVCGGVCVTQKGESSGAQAKAPALSDDRLLVLHTSGRGWWGALARGVVVSG